MEWHIGILIWLVSGLAFVMGWAMGAHRSSRIPEVWERTAREEAQPWCGRRRD